MPQQPLSQVPADATWDWRRRGSCREADPEPSSTPERGGDSHVCAATVPPKPSVPSATSASNVPTMRSAPANRTAWGGLTEEERERVYVRIALAQFPVSAEKVPWQPQRKSPEAVSPGAMGVVS